MSKQETQTWEKVVRYIFGFICIAVILYLNVVISKPTPSQQETFRIVLALSAAGLAGVLTGFLNIHGKISKFAVRAGGAFALFILVYFFPPSVLSNPQPRTPSNEIHQTITGNGGTQVGTNSGTMIIGNTIRETTDTIHKP